MTPELVLSRVLAWVVDWLTHGDSFSVGFVRALPRPLNVPGELLLVIPTLRLGHLHTHTAMSNMCSPDKALGAAGTGGSRHWAGTVCVLTHRALYLLVALGVDDLLLELQLCGTLRRVRKLRLLLLRLLLLLVLLALLFPEGAASTSRISSSSNSQRAEGGRRRRRGGSHYTLQAGGCCRRLEGAGVRSRT